MSATSPLDYVTVADDMDGEGGAVEEVEEDDAGGGSASPTRGVQNAAVIMVPRVKRTTMDAMDGVVTEIPSGSSQANNNSNGAVGTTTDGVVKSKQSPRSSMASTAWAEDVGVSSVVTVAA
jgi:hypothetical protein